MDLERLRITFKGVVFEVEEIVARLNRLGTRNAPA
jgi:hypothetical protein